MPDIPPFEPSPTQVIVVALTDLRDPEWNPRDFYDEEEMQSLMDFIKAGGRIEPIVIWTPSPENAEDEPIGPSWAIISGKRRREAYRRLGRTHIEAIPLDIPLEEAMFMAIAANRDSKPFWLGEFIRVERLKLKYEKLKQVEIKARTGWNDKRVSQSIYLTKLLTPASRELITQFKSQNLTGRKISGDEVDQKPEQKKLWRLTEDVAVRLIPLWDKDAPEASQAKAERAVRIIIVHQLTGPQTDDLVTHILAGNDPAQFEPNAKSRKSKTGKSGNQTHKSKSSAYSDEVLAKVAELGRLQGLAEGRGEDPTAPQTALKDYLAEVKTQTPLVVPPPSFKVTSPEGLALLRQAIENLKTLFKSRPSEPAQTLAVSHAGAVPIIPEPEVTPSAVKTPKAAENFFLDWLAGVSVIHQIRKKVEKREPLTKGEILILAGDKFGIFLGWMIKILLRLIIGFFKLGWKLMKETYKAIDEVMPKKGKVGKFFKTVKLLLLIAFWGAVAWLILDIRQNGIWQPINLIRYKFHLFTSASSPQDEKRNLSVPISPNQEVGISNANSRPQETQSAVQTPVTPQMEIVRNAKLKTSHSKLLTSNSASPVAPYQPSISFNTSVSSTNSSPVMTLYDPKLLEQEITAVPKNAIVKAFPLTPDETMPGDLAVSRMQGVTDPDKYTLMIDGGKQKIISITATSTNLILNYKSADAINDFFSHEGVITLFWEDVLYIHSDEIDVQNKIPFVLFQCSLIGSGAKNAIAFHCASADDLKHLVSTMEYFIRNSRLGHDTVLAGMPYLTQGIRFGNDTVVEKLWANSPADKAGLVLGDHLWSVGKVTSDQQEKKVLETALSTYANDNNNEPLAQSNLSPRLLGSAQVPVTVFVASDSDWNKANIAKNSGMTPTFRPKLRKVILMAF